MLLGTDQEKSVYLSGTREGAIHTDFGTCIVWKRVFKDIERAVLEKKCIKTMLQ